MDFQSYIKEDIKLSHYDNTNQKSFFHQKAFLSTLEFCGFL